MNLLCRRKVFHVKYILYADRWTLLIMGTIWYTCIKLRPITCIGWLYEIKQTFNTIVFSFNCYISYSRVVYYNDKRALYRLQSRGCNVRESCLRYLHIILKYVYYNISSSVELRSWWSSIFIYFHDIIITYLMIICPTIPVNGIVHTSF